MFGCTWSLLLTVRIPVSGCVFVAVGLCWWCCQQDLDRLRRELEQSRRETKRANADAAENMARFKAAEADAADLRAQLLAMQAEVRAMCMRPYCWPSC